MSVEIFYTEEFRQRYQELPIAIKKKAERKAALFREYPFSPTLQTEKLSPKQLEVWSFRIDREYRIIFRFRDAQSAYFLTCGHHNWVYDYLRHLR